MDACAPTQYLLGGRRHHWQTKTLTPHAPDALAPARALAASLSAADHAALAALLRNARQTPPTDYLTLRCGPQALGTMPAPHAAWLASTLGHCHYEDHAEDHALVWNALRFSPVQRSEQLQAALVQLRDLGHLAAWRHEAFSFWPQADALPDPGQPEFLRIERAGFRFLGLMSHAVHINGFTPDGRLWCGQRSASKATDPGQWDNLTAGGLGAGESLAACAARELYEEAGYRLQAPEQLTAVGRVRISRATPTGWHDEMLHVYDLRLPGEFVPHNQDGEVQGFACLSGPQMMARMPGPHDGREANDRHDLHHPLFTHDAALAIAQSLQHAQTP